MKRFLLKNFLFGLSLFCITYSFAQKAVPELWSQHVHDDAHVLQQVTVDSLEKKLRTYRDSTSNEVAILIVQSLDGEVLEEYSLRVAEKWKLGQKEKDNGVLFLIAVDDHKMRIEVGQGLEGVLTDAQSNRIIRNEIAPEFRRGDYDAGVAAGIDGIIKAIGGEYQADEPDSSDTELSFTDKIVFGLFIFGMLGMFTSFAVVAQGRSGWGLYAFLIPFYAAFPWVILGWTGALILLGLYIIMVPILRLTFGKSKKVQNWIEKHSKSSGKSSDWGSSWSSGSSSSSWGSSSSSSSWSGGGGSFGGGGSSGSW